MEDANDGEAVATAGFTVSDDEALSTRAGAGAYGQTLPVEPLSPQRYKVQFTAGEEYVKLVEEAQALLSHSAPRDRGRDSAQKSEPEPQSEHQQPDAEHGQSQIESEYPRRRGRHVPAAVRRAVFERDEGRCTYADSSGQRCAETHRLELHHLRAFARGGEHTEENLTLRCHAHNALAAEEDFGRHLIELARGASEYEPWAAQSGA
jgi:hypothetical protein